MFLMNSSILFWNVLCEIYLLASNKTNSSALMKTHFLIYNILIYSFLIMLSSCVEKEKNTASWVALSDGETLKGWEQKGREAHYEVRDGAIVGITKLRLTLPTEHGVEEFMMNQEEVG